MMSEFILRKCEYSHKNIKIGVKRLDESEKESEHHIAKLWSHDAVSGHFTETADKYTKIDVKWPTESKMDINFVKLEHEVYFTG